MLLIESIIYIVINKTFETKENFVQRQNQFKHDRVAKNHFLKNFAEMYSGVSSKDTRIPHYLGNTLMKEGLKRM